VADPTPAATPAPFVPPTPPTPAAAGSVPVAGAIPPPAAKPPVAKVKKESDDKVFVWPDLVAEEFVAALFFTALLFAWSIWINAPLEEPANGNRTPNPSRAPWYFIGLQELLVYFDPWIAGVILPGLIIVGLMAIRYLDNDNRGIGWYSIKERPLANTIFLSGLGMWFTLIFIGTFMRGPSWGLYMPWESWHIHKPFPPATWSFTTAPRPGSHDKSVIPGVVLVLGYFAAMLALPKRIWPKFYEQLGAVKYVIVMALLACMIGVPIKMFLRIGLAIKYVLSVPQVNFNI